MQTVLNIAWRYFKGKKSAKAINIISRISISAIILSTAAMVVLFSVVNGLEITIKEMYSAFYSDMRVKPAQGKFFDISEHQLEKIKLIDGIHIISPSIEDMALISGYGNQQIVVLKGVDNSWFNISNLNSFLIEGNPEWDVNASYIPLIAGLRVAHQMSIDVGSAFNDLKVFYPKVGSHISFNPEQALNSMRVQPTGIFRVDDEFDGQYVLTTITAAQELFGRHKQYSSLEMSLTNKADEKNIKEQVKEILGNNIIIENRYEQNKLMYSIINSEKLAIYAILLLVLFIASFNMIGSLSMLVMEKRKDISILKSMGATNQTIANIYLSQGLIMSGFGAVTGLLLGFLLCLGQQIFGWVPLPEGFVIDAYPVEMRMVDFLITLITVLVVGFLASWLPAKRAAGQPLFSRNQ